MKDHHANILRAVLAVLSQRTEPLPANIQQQLHQLGQTLSTHPNQIPLLEALAIASPELRPGFEQVMILQEASASERAKGIDDLLNVAPIPETSFNIELENNASAIGHLESYRQLLTQLQALPESSLLQRTIQTLLNPDSVEAASDMISPPPF